MDVCTCVLTVAAALVLAQANPLFRTGVFPIAVWLQEPAMAAKYKAAGFNLYVGLWQGPTEQQLKDLKAAGMPVVCDQNAVGIKHIKDPTIVGWMHGDEPDNAQPLKDPATGKDTWGPCVPPQKIVDEYRALKKADPSRPVMLNLGQGVANDAWYGRGNGAKLSDYETYVKGCDIVSFDVYPIAGLQKPDQIGLVSKGVDRLVKWTGGNKRVWNCLECTDIDGKGKPTPEQVKAEAWSAIIHGSRGLIYFVHQFQPKFDEHALLDDPVMLKAVTDLNAQIQRYALRFSEMEVNSGFGPQVESFATAHGKTITVFAVSLQDHSVKAELHASGRVEEVEEHRTVSVQDGQATETFAPCQVHIYRIQD